MTHDQIVAALVQYERNSRADPNRVVACACAGCAEGEPFCFCVMRRIRGQADELMKVAGEAK